MVDEFPSNSRQRRPAVSDSNKVNQPAKEEAPKLEPVVTGKVVRRKKPLGRRFMDTFFRGEGVLGYLGKEVLLPAFQNLITDFVTQGVERAVYGDAPPSTRRNAYRPGGANRTHITYNQPSSIISRNTPSTNYHDRRANHNRSSVDIGEIVLDDRIQVEIVAEKLLETLENYGSVTVANLNELLQQSSQHLDYRFGWVDLDQMAIRKVREGYLLILPEPEDLR